MLSSMQAMPQYSSDIFFRTLKDVMGAAPAPGSLMIIDRFWAGHYERRSGAELAVPDAFGIVDAIEEAGDAGGGVDNVGETVAVGILEIVQIEAVGGFDVG